MSVHTYDPSNDQPVCLTSAAAAHFKDYLKQQNAIAIQVTTKKTGCSGLSYALNPVSEILENHLDYQDQGIRLLVDRGSLMYLSGLRIDYVKQELGLSQLVFDNPNESARCGCGESFTVQEVE